MPIVLGRAGNRHGSGVLVSGDHTVIHGYFEDIAPVAEGVDVFFFDTPAVDDSWSPSHYVNWLGDLFLCIDKWSVKCLILACTDRKGAGWSKSALTVSQSFVYGWRLHRQLIWHHGSSYHRAHLPYRILYTLKRGEHRSAAMYRDIIRVPKSGSSEGLLSEIPVELVASVLKHYAFETDVVMDPFAGSGSVMKACRRLGLRSISVEADRELAEKIAKEVQCGETGNHPTIFWRD